MNKNFIQQQLDEIKGSAWAFLVKRWRLTLIVLLSIALGGFISLTSMPLESDPEVKVPIGVVTTIFPGASPTDVEKLITDKLETDLKTLDDLKIITSSSQEGVSSITVEFEATADLTESIRKLRDRVNEAKSSLPEEAEDPAVLEIRTNDIPIITFSMMGNLTPEEFELFGEKLQEELEQIQGVSKAVLSGVESEEMQVLINPVALEGFQLSLSEVVQAIQSNHIEFPIGSLLVQDFYYQASLKAQLSETDDLLNLPIANRNGRNIFLKDIAEVRKVFSEKSTITKIYQASSKQFRSSVNLQIYKKTGANIIEIIEAAKQVVKDYQTEKLPPSMDILITGDNSEFIREDIGTLSESGIQSITVIFFLLLLALGKKEAVIAAVSIPFIFLVSFIVLYLSGETFNFMVLFSLILAIGLIVDTSIVVIEGVHENLKEKKMDSTNASLLAIQTYKYPLIASTFTTISAFLPMALMPGIVGEYMSHIPRTVTITLFSSLFIALVILPSVSAHVFKNVHKKEIKKAWLDRFMNPFKNWYAQFIHRVLISKWKRRSWVIGMVVASMAAIALPATGIMKVQMWPAFDGDYFTVNIEGPIGATLEDTSEVAEKVEEYILELPEIDNFVTITGGSALAVTSDGPGTSLGGATSFNKASITVNLVKKDFREYSALEISELLREKVKPITEADVEVQDLQTGPPRGADVEVRITGEDINQLEITAQAIAKELASIEGTRDVDTDVEHGTGEFHFTVKRDQLTFYNLTVGQLANELRTAVFGSRQIKIIKSGEETPIVIRLDYRDPDCVSDTYTSLIEKRDRLTICSLRPKSVDQINRLLVNTLKGQIPLRELVDIELNPAITTIRHRDTERVMHVRGSAQLGYVADVIRQQLEVKISNMDFPEGIHVEFGGEFEDTQESFNALWKAMYVGLILIIFILVLQFNSFRQPFIIVFTLPLALIGVFFGMTAIGRNFSFPMFIGIVALMGVVVNDAIVLIDRINTNIRSGMEKIEAIVNAGKERMQPIFLTTITTATGVLPLVWASTFWVDLALAIFFGIIFATLLTLIMVPIFYNALESGEELKMIKDSSEPL